MGCCSSDALPDVPDVIIDDPDVNTTIKAVVKRLGRGRDFSVHKDEYPSNSTEVTQKMWLWFNKSNGGVVDLENFVRGWSEEFPKKGKVLWSAKVTERPVFEQFQRVARSDIRDRFFGFFGTSGQKGLHNESQKSGYDSDDDDYYIRHQTHQAKFGRGRRHLGQAHHDIITKWRLHTRAVITDGNLGRGADILKGQEIILEVFSKGTAATGWEEIETRRTDENGKEHVTRRDEKRETEWVDRVEFRLTVAGQLWAEWVVQGDSHYTPGANANVSCPLFDTVIEGGWFSKTSYITTTKADVDPALALLIAHLCYTEYSVAEIKNDLRPNTPARPPNMWTYNAPNKHIMHYNGGAVNGTFVWKM